MALSLWSLFLAFASVGAQTPPATTGEPAAAAEEAPAATGIKEGVLVEPPDGEWLTDDEGRQYFLIEVPKVEGFYRWIDEDTVRLRNLPPMDVGRHDDEAFHLKYYRVDVKLPEHVGPSEEALAKAAATYVAEVASSDVFKLIPFDEGLPRRGQWRNGFEVADMNGDGHLDIVHGPLRKGIAQPVIFLGDGKGKWRHWSEATYPSTHYDYGDVAVADFNGDGHLDLGLAMHFTGIFAMVGDGKGNFRAWSEGLALRDPRVEQGVHFTSRTLEAADWNRDGRPDLLALAEGPGAPSQMNLQLGRGVRVYLNNGDGTWAALDAEPGTMSVVGNALEVADFNKDGYLDFLTASVVMGERHLLNLGNEDGSWTSVELAQLRPRPAIWYLTVDDLDRDGHLDIVLNYTNRELGIERSGIDILYGRPGKEPVFERRPLYSTEDYLRLRTVGTGDLDGDGNVDLVAYDGYGVGWLFRGDGAGFFTREPDNKIGSPNHCRPYAVELVDLDGDGRDEILTGFAGEPVTSFAAAAAGRAAQCRNNGSLRIWKTEPTGLAAEQTSSSGE